MTDQMYTLEDITRGVFQVQGEVTMQHNRINAIKMVRTLTKCGLREAKEAVDAEIKRQSQPKLETLVGCVEFLRGLVELAEPYEHDAYATHNYAESNLLNVNRQISELIKAINVLKENQ